MNASFHVCECLSMYVSEFVSVDVIMFVCACLAVFMHICECLSMCM